MKISRKTLLKLIEYYLDPYHNKYYRNRIKPRLYKELLKRWHKNNPETYTYGTGSTNAISKNYLNNIYDQNNNVFRNFGLRTTTSLKINISVIVSRRTMMLIGSKLSSKTEINAFKKIVTAHNNMLRQEVQTTETFIDFCKVMYPLNPKIFQHFLEVSYPKRLYSLDKIRNIFSNIDVSETNHGLFIDNSLLITALQGRLIAMNPPDKQVHHNTTIALQQIKQSFPDFIYYFDDKQNTWRYYDLKTGTLKINRGHVISIFDTEDYETLVKYIITHQLKLYVDKFEIRDFIENLLQKNDLSWTARNVALHNFYKEILWKYPDINPSMVFKHDLTYEAKIMLVSKQVDGLVTTSAVSSEQHTENVLKDVISAGGPKVINNYLKQSHNNNNNIAKALQAIAEESLNYLKKIH